MFLKCRLKRILPLRLTLIHRRLAIVKGCVRVSESYLDAVSGEVLDSVQRAVKLWCQCDLSLQ